FYNIILEDKFGRVQHAEKQNI
ncbi:hypothetical protein, partial [Staphylococcus aureus]